MKRVLVRYKTSPDKAEDNQRLIEAVFRDLATQAPAGLRYAVFRLADGGFVHVAETEGDANPLFALDSFKAFSGTAKERCIEPPVTQEAVIVGNYHMLERP